MTSVHALPGLASKMFYFSLVASVFTFVSMLLFDHSPSLKAGCESH
jgi:hypothetical protein